MLAAMIVAYRGEKVGNCNQCEVCCTSEEGATSHVLQSASFLSPSCALNVISFQQRIEQI